MNFPCISGPADCCSSPSGRRKEVNTLTREEYKALALEVSNQAIRNARHRSMKQYILDNWIAILALIVSIIALFK